MRRHRQDLQPLTEMNVTNLLDTAFILLMAFMIVAPTIKHGIQIDVPKVENTKQMDSPKPMTVTIKKAERAEGSDEITFDQRRLDYADLQKALSDKKQADNDLDIIMEIDKDVSWNTVAKALGAIQSAGIDNVGFRTELPKKEGRK